MNTFKYVWYKPFAQYFVNVFFCGMCCLLYDNCVLLILHQCAYVRVYAIRALACDTSHSSCAATCSRYRQYRTTKLLLFHYNCHVYLPYSLRSIEAKSWSIFSSTMTSLLNRRGDTLIFAMASDVRLAIFCWGGLPVKEVALS